MMTSQHTTVCDTCRARKVKCDRNDPCGNCVDGNIRCSRTFSVNRLARSTSKRPRGAEAPSAQKSSRKDERQESPSPSRHSLSVSQSPSILEARDFIRHEISSRQHIPADRLAVLKSAISFVNRLTRDIKPLSPSGAPSTRVLDVLEDITYPSVETLYWMLRELRGNKLGPHVLDFFKHVSPKSLKRMGLALITRAESPETLLLYSICVNSTAFKFIKTVLSEDSMEEVGAAMRTCAVKYLRSIQLAMARIHLLSGPSLVFLQALLCSAFIAQGVGDSANCWTFITAACKVCEDLNLEAQVNACQRMTEDDEEMYYCYIWCHILDKNYSMMQGRSRCLLESRGLDFALSSPFNKSMSSLLSTYLHFVPIQASFIRDLHQDKILNNTTLLSTVDSTARDLLEWLERVHTQITELYQPADSWGGLHIASELNTLQFSYYSLRTSILRSRQICLPAAPYIDKDCLESARIAMMALKSIQQESVAITDVRAHVSYMHWTLLFHPLTPFFVLFCNVMISDDEHDFELLKLVTSQLDKLADLSESIAKLQSLFKSFTNLCEDLMMKRGNSLSPGMGVERGPVFTEVSREPSLNSQPASHATVTFEPAQSGTNDFLSQQLVPTVIAREDDEECADLNELAMFDPGWELFDTQPTLNWLDTDFSYVDESPEQ